MQQFWTSFHLLPKLNFLGSVGALAVPAALPNVNFAAGAEAAPKLNLAGDAAAPAVLGPGWASSCNFVASLEPPNENLAADTGGLLAASAAGELDTLGAAAAGPLLPLPSACFELPPGVLCGVTEAGLDGTLPPVDPPGAVPPATMWCEHSTEAVQA